MKDNWLGRHDNGRLKTVLSTLGYDIDKYVKMARVSIEAINSAAANFGKSVSFSVYRVDNF